MGCPHGAMSLYRPVRRLRHACLAVPHAVVSWSCVADAVRHISLAHGDTLDDRVLRKLLTRVYDDAVVITADDADGAAPVPDAPQEIVLAQAALCDALDSKAEVLSTLLTHLSVHAPSGLTMLSGTDASFGGCRLV